MTAKNNIYTERNRLVAYLASQWPSILCPDDKDPEYAIVFIDLQTGQVSWHIPLYDLFLFAHVPFNKEQISSEIWDHHSTEEKYDRLKLLINVVE